MSPKDIPKKPSMDEYLAFLNGPKVDIYVGPTKKHYRLPKLLLCHYSTYFDRCFNGSFAEAKTQTLELPEDDIMNFEFLLESIFSRGTFPNQLGSFAYDYETACGYLKFLEFADKYDMGGFSCDAVYDGLKDRMHYYTFQSADIELIYRVAPKKSPLRFLAVQCALDDGGIDGKKTYYSKLEREVGGFAADLLQQMRESLHGTVTWRARNGQLRKNVFR